MAISDLALMLVDIQKGVMAPGRSNLGMEANALALLAAFRQAGLPVIHLQHASTEHGSQLTPGLPGFHFRDGFEPRPGERHQIKSVTTPFQGTTLAENLRAEGIGHLVMAGVCLEHCVSSVVRAASNLGFRITLAGDACHAWERRAVSGTPIPAEEIHRIELAILNGEYCSVVSTAEALSLARPQKAAE